MRSLSAVLAILLGITSTLSASAVEKAFDRMYNFDFAGAHTIVDSHLSDNPTDELGYAVRGAAFLFQELHRLRILESEFFAEDKRVIAKKGLKPDPQIRDSFNAALQRAQAEAQKVLDQKPNDAQALFAMSLVSGLQADYMALVDKRQFQSLSTMKEAQSWSVRLLKAHPSYVDAELTGGACEYLLGSMPFFLRWFIRIDGVEGQKSIATQKLERVASSGKYLGPFARILLAIVHLREKQPSTALSILRKLSDDYPGNPLFRQEATKIATMLEKR